MSNLAGVTKDMYPEGTTADLGGFEGPNGERLLNVEFTQEEVDSTIFGSDSDQFFADLDQEACDAAAARPPLDQRLRTRCRTT